MAARKAAKQANRAARQAVRGEDVQFSGALSNKSKDNLIDIAHHLTIKTTGTKADLLKAIWSRFETDQHLKTDPRFEGLFSSHLRAAMKWPIEQTNLDSENIPPPATCQCIDAVPPMVASFPNAVQTAIKHTPFLTSSMASSTAGPLVLPSFALHSTPTHPFTPAPFNPNNSMTFTPTFVPTTVPYSYYYPNPESITGSSVDKNV